MDIKKEILVRTYLVFVVLVVFCITILGKVLYIQWGEGSHWRKQAKLSQIKLEKIEAERGTIYSEAGQVLSTSVPEFDIYIDFQADGLVEKGGDTYRKYADSLAIGLAAIFRDKTKAAYRRILDQGFREGDRFFLLKRKISYAEFQQLYKLPLVKEGKNKSGFIADVRMKRLYPFRMLANRTIGIARDSNKVGLELAYDRYLGGVPGKRLVRYIAGGGGIPVEGSDQEPSDGSNLVSTLDVQIQEAAQEALRKMMVSNEAEYGTCIVMEVKTGKIRAIANLGRQSDGNYYEDYNYALTLSEPGSTFKLVTLMSVLADKKARLDDQLDLEGGIWTISGNRVKDSEAHGLHTATVQQAFEKSSNVGMAKLAYTYYGSQPSKFFQHLRDWHLDTITGIDLPGERRPVIYRPGSKWWSNTTLPWMSFGYNLSISPLQTAMLYNAVANRGKMMKPYLVNALLRDGVTIKSFEPVVLNPAIVAPEVIEKVHQSLKGVVEKGTAHTLKTNLYDFAGKTGTSKVADKGIKYDDNVYQSSFAGYFPADRPEYTIVVVIRNKPHAQKVYGSQVAGPVFREVADKIYASRIYARPENRIRNLLDSTAFQLAGQRETLRQLSSSFGWNFKDSSSAGSLAWFSHEPGSVKVLRNHDQETTRMPALEGTGLKDALRLCEARGLQVMISGSGKVSSQSIEPGGVIRRGQQVKLFLN